MKVWEQTLAFLNPLGVGLATHLFDLVAPTGVGVVDHSGSDQVVTQVDDVRTQIVVHKALSTVLLFGHDAQRSNLVT
ncbi:hypothetical protein D3C86_2042270 [compost metagenome]